MSDDRLPPLNSLQAFEAAGRHESFLHAAAEQDVSPSSISRHVRLLERALGTILFVRRSNGVRLTPAGNVYARRVSRIIRDLRRATAQVRAAQPTREP
ncbi:MAG: LysR family transcriptional regulator [Gammaproteobacteria bacterium]|nr:LysR family transcriptional regulator [Gammaproteobacteria bacterium]